MRTACALLLTILLPMGARGDAASPRRLDLSELRLPPGFEISIYARGVGNARMMAFSPTGTLFVSDTSGGRIRVIPSANQVQTFASGLNSPHGLAFRGNDLYVAENHRIVVFRNAGNPSLQAGTPEVIAPLPAGLIGHITRTLLWDRDGNLVATAGSTCNICTESDPRRAAAMRFNADGSGMQIFAKGLRNSVGLALHPVTGEIWATDNGGDGLGDEQPPEEINVLRAGNDYGWPRCYGSGQRYPGFTGDCSSAVPPELAMQAHSAPLGISFYAGEMFPARYLNDAFVAFHGSWNRTVPTGYKVVRVLASSGRATGIEDFLTGFLNGTTTSGRPVHALTGPDGALYVTDDQNGVVYRVSYSGPRLNPNGLVTAAAKVDHPAPGSLVSLYGVNLKAQAVNAAALPLPLNLEEVSVTVNGVQAPLLYAGPQQVNFQIPFGLRGPVEIALTNGRITDTIQTELRATSPAIFTVDQTGSGLAAYTRAGDTISIYCTGLGEVDPPVAAGAAAPRSPLSRVVNDLSVTISGIPAPVTFAGLAPDFAGLYQVNATIPPDVQRGRRATLALTAGGAASNPVDVIP
ncbi:MAG: PQQ-dependent sugar dehydrogenase [Acidobacteria bacterium]|nr:PQQ-dependent sugar dehydrogenase [Acidobacteriota bacterium]